MRWLGWTLLAVAALSLIAVIVLLATLVRNAPALLAPPGLAERLRVYLTRNVAELSPDARFPELVSPRLPMPPDQALDEVRNAMRALGWQLVDAAATDDATDNTARAGSGLSAQVRSPLLGFVDELSPGRVDQKGGRFHGGQLRCADHHLVLGGVGHV